MKQKRHDQNGQVLILVVIVMLIITLAILFLFDLQTIIRGKMKMETAEQAAAMTAANWQKESLNLIGELNLVKACDVLISDIEPVNSSTASGIAASSRSVTEMQARISFIGPLVGLGAAQQAAKNNGMAVNSALTYDMNEYLEKLQVDPRYTVAGGVPEYIAGYQWREPYISMLTAITEQGMAVRPNGRFPGLEGVDPRWLTDQTLYSAIRNRLWCNPTLNMLVKLPDSYWGGKWWNIAFSNTVFPEESEIYTLRVQYIGADGNRETTYDVAANSIARMASDRGIDVSQWDVLKNVTWCTYDSSWDQNSTNYNGPDVSIWNGSRFLRDNLKDSFLYGGPLAYAEGYQNVKTMNKYGVAMSRPGSSGSENLTKAKAALRNNVVSSVGSREIKVGNDITQDLQPGGALAKVIGQIDSNTPPNASVIVLPVFSEAALIPSSMQAYRPMRGDFSDLERFLIWLSEVDDLHNPESSPPDGTQGYLEALQLLDTPEFRKTGYNNDFDHSSITDDKSYFFDDYHYDPGSNPSGAGWLQQAYTRVDASYDPLNPNKDVTESQDGWNTCYSFNGRVIMRDRNGNLITNDQAVCNWMPGGPGPGAPGVEIGPPRL